MRAAILFIDGVGVGPNDPTHNPLARGSFLLSQFEGGEGQPLPHFGRRHDVDTTFGVAGRPQSASNQTAIYTGRPAPAILGRHVLGYPNAALKDLLAEHSVVKLARDFGRTATLANAYPEFYLEALRLRSEANYDVSDPLHRQLKNVKAAAGTLAMQAAGVPLRTLADLSRGLGLTHDVDGATAGLRLPEVPQRSPEAAAEVFWNLSADLTVFEHFLADEAGHNQDPVAAQAALSTFDRFARQVLALQPPDVQVFIVSDHGNVEDLSTRNHTRNPVAVLSFGEAVFQPLTTVADVGRAVLEVLGVSG